jgi:hypothetical protein
MINHIKIVCLLIVSSLLLAQPVTIDSSKVVNTEIPPTIKPVVEEIVTNSKESQAASVEISKEMKKQIALMKQIKLKINELKKSPVGTKIDKVALDTKKVSKDVDSMAVKSNDVIIEVEGQIVQWETKDRSWFGRMFHSTDVLFYPFIVDKNGKKIYLK